jgi:hypothetical protein
MTISCIVFISAYRSFEIFSNSISVSNIFPIGARKISIAGVVPVKMDEN